MRLVFLLLFSWLVVRARTWRGVMAVCLVGTVGAVMIAPRPVQAQGSLVEAIQSVLNVINGIIRSALNSVQAVRNAMSFLYQSLVWPVQLINQARAQVTRMIGQYKTRMQGLYDIDLRSATLPAPQALEEALRNHQTDDFGNLTTAYANTYQSIPTASAASPADRAMADMDDALALDNLKTLKATDRADELTLQAASDLENEASQAAPGSAPFLTASAVTATVESQALTQKMLAAELRQEAVHLAHHNSLRKRGAVSTGQVANQIINLLKRR